MDGWPDKPPDGDGDGGPGTFELTLIEVTQVSSISYVLCACFSFRLLLTRTQFLLSRQGPYVSE